jgi:hypothetical protein
LKMSKDAFPILLPASSFSSSSDLKFFFLYFFLF